MSTQTELRDAVWRACTVIRNEHRDVKKYIEYTAMLLFMKFYDDLYATLPDDVKGLIPQQYRWSTLKGLDPRGFAGYHPDVLVRLRDFFANKRWRGRDAFGIIFDNFQFDIKHDEVLGKALLTLDKINFTWMDYDQKGDLYEFLIAKMADAGVKGEFFTPRPIVDMIIDVVRPRYGMKVWDPACGTGGFLSRAFEEMLEDLQATQEVDAADYRAGLRELRYRSIFGNETESTSARLARMNMILRGDGHSSILEFNSLDRQTYTERQLEIRGGRESNPIPDILKSGGFDLIVANPPYGGSQAVCDVGGLFGKWRKSSKPEANFLQIMMEALKPGGRCGVLMPEGVLFRREESKIRERLLKEFDLQAIVGLFKGAFDRADVKACVLFFRRPNSGEKWRGTREVWIAETRSIEDIMRVPSMWGETPDGGMARPVSVEEIRERGGTLRPAKFLTIQNESERTAHLVPLNTMLVENKTVVLIDDDVEYSRISVALYGRGARMRDRVLGAGLKTKRQQVVHAGQVVMSNIWARKQAFGMVPAGLEGVLASTDFTLFDVRCPAEELDADYLKYILAYGPLAEVLAVGAEGSTGKARVRPDDFLSLEVPKPLRIEEQQLVVRRMSAQERIRDEAEELLEGVARLDWLDDSVFDVPSSEVMERTFGPLVEDASVFVEPSREAQAEWQLYRLTNKDGVFPGKLRLGAEFSRGRRYKAVVAGAIAYDTRRVNVGSVGIMPPGGDHSIISPYRVLFRCKEGLSTRFAVYLIKSPLFRRLIAEAQVGAVRDELFLSAFQDIEVSIPKLDRQEAIVAEIEARLEAYARVRVIQQQAQATMHRIVRREFGLEWERSNALPDDTGEKVAGEEEDETGEDN